MIHKFVKSKSGYDNYTYTVDYSFIKYGEQQILFPLFVYVKVLSIYIFWFIRNRVPLILSRVSTQKNSFDCLKVGNTSLYEVCFAILFKLTINIKQEERNFPSNVASIIGPSITVSSATVRFTAFSSTIDLDSLLRTS